MSSILLFFFLLVLTAAYSSSYSGGDHCDPRSQPDPVTLSSDKITVLISGYSEARIPLLSSIALSYSAHPLVSSVLILWFNPSTPSPLLSPLLDLSSSISLHMSSAGPHSSSLAARFLPRGRHIRTRSVLVCDDDVEVPHSSLAFAFQIARSNPRRLVGFFARSHGLDLGGAGASWIYTVHPDRYSIMLTKFMMVRTEHLYNFSCWERLRGAREYVERERNCEDILMNFVAAMDTGEGPLLVDGRGIRDWGDPRNEDSSNVEGDRGGALSARGDHRRKRGECIREFHRLIGEMPLIYSYAKLVEGVGVEQGLCLKGGTLVPCDSQI